MFSPCNADFGSILPKSPSLFFEIIVRNFNSSSSDNAIPTFINGNDTGIVSSESISRILIISTTFFSNHSVSYFFLIDSSTIFLAKSEAFFILSK